MKRIAGSIAPVALALLAACAGHSGSALPPQTQSAETAPSTTTLSAMLSVTPSPSPTPFPSTYTVGAGEIFGKDNAFVPNDGDTTSGGVGQTIDGSLPCVTTMPSAYHVHAFVGIIINGRQMALPDGTGMKNPGADGTYNGVSNWTEYASCYYYMHTHDASGVIHIESPKSASPSTSLYTLGNYFDVWGRALNSSYIGPWSGTVRAYVAQVPLNTIYIQRSAYTLYTSNPRFIPMHSHTTVWLELGPTYVTPSQLPVIHYYEEY